MTGMERNSGGGGAVLAGAYAPLMVNANARPWPTNMLVFDNHRWGGGGPGARGLHQAGIQKTRRSPSWLLPSPGTGDTSARTQILLSPPGPWRLLGRRVFGIPSFHVQQLLSRHLGTQLVGTEVAGGAEDWLAASATCQSKMCDEVSGAVLGASPPHPCTSLPSWAGPRLRCRPVRALHLQPPIQSFRPVSNPSPAPLFPRRWPSKWSTSPPASSWWACASGAWRLAPWAPPASCWCWGGSSRWMRTRFTSP